MKYSVTVGGGEYDEVWDEEIIVAAEWLWRSQSAVESRLAELEVSPEVQVLEVHTIQGGEYD